MKLRRRKVSGQVRDVRSPRSTGLGSVEARGRVVALSWTFSHPGLRAWAPLKPRTLRRVGTGDRPSPRSTGLGSVEAPRTTAASPTTRRHPGLRAWAPLKPARPDPAPLPLPSHPGLRAWAPLKRRGRAPDAEGVDGMSPRSTGLGSVEATAAVTAPLVSMDSHPGLRAWAPLKRHRWRSPRVRVFPVTQVYGPGLR